MRGLWFVLLIILVCLIVALIAKGAEESVDHDTVRVVTQWGRTAPPYVVDGAATSTTTQARARTAPSKRTTMRATSAAPPVVVDGAWSCGGDLPPCWVMDRENPNRDLTVYNGGCHAPVGYDGPPPCGGRHSTASGKWQILRSTWAGYMGFVNAADAPWDVQDARARQLWGECPRVRHWATC